VPKALVAACSCLEILNTVQFSAAKTMCQQCVKYCYLFYLYKLVVVVENTKRMVPYIIIVLDAIQLLIQFAAFILLVFLFAP